MPYDVFVSYSQPDRECAVELVSRLEAHALRVWIAPRDISPSADWAAEIIDAISAARLMVLVFSSHSNVSQQVRREVERAVHKQLPVLPFRIEDVMPSRSLEYFLSAQHWLDAFPPPREPHYVRLCAHLDALLHGTAGTDTHRRDTPRASDLSASNTLTSFSPTPAELQLLERQLAQHIGPLAKHLVRRAAGRAESWEQLTLQLATEVDSDAARRQFIAACRSLARPAT